MTRWLSGPARLLGPARLSGLALLWTSADGGRLDLAREAGYGCGANDWGR